MDSDADDSSLESYIPVDFSKGPLYFGNMRWDPGRVRVAFVPDSPVVQAHQGIVLLNKMITNDILIGCVNITKVPVSSTDSAFQWYKSQDKKVLSELIHLYA